MDQLKFIVSCVRVTEQFDVVRWRRKEMEMVWVMNVQLMLFILMSSSFGQRIRVRREYYDEFNDTVTFVGPGGHVEITCTTTNNQCPGKEFELMFEFGGNRMKVASTFCVAGSGTFRLNIMDDTNLGTYSCMMNNDRQNFPLVDRMCGDQSSVCRNYAGTCQGTDQFCAVTVSPSSATGQSNPCNSSGLTSCTGTYLGYRYQSVVYCPPGSVTFCDVVYGYYTGRNFVEARATSCNRFGHVWMKMGTVTYPFNAYIQINADQFANTTMEYHCSNGSLVYGKNFSCLIKSVDKTVFQSNKSECNDVAQVRLDRNVFGDMSNIYKAKCDFYTQANATMATITQFLVVFVGNVRIRVNHVKGTYLECKLEVPEKMNVFFEWTGQKTGIREKGPVLNITQNDTYVCNATIVYKSCSPHRLFSHSLMGMVIDPIVPPRTSHSPTAETHPAPPSTEFWTKGRKTALIVFCVVTSLLTIAAVVAGCYAFSQYRLLKIMEALGYTDEDDVGGSDEDSDDDTMSRSDMSTIRNVSKLSNDRSKKKGKANIQKKTQGAKGRKK